MLYGNAQLHDEWDGEGYSGSSLRGALKGFQNNGLCSVETARSVVQEASQGGTKSEWRWFTNRAVREEATKLTLGAYYRVPLILTDMHSAILESGVLVASAAIHEGWMVPDDKGFIAYEPQQETEIIGHHAFAIVGYDQKGWIVQNSWGTSWGEDGTAIWRYSDWANNATDVWAMRLSAEVTDGIRHSLGKGATSLVSLRERSSTFRDPTRMDVLGHFLPIEDGRLVRYGRYHHDQKTLRETIKIIKRKNDSASRQKLNKASEFRYQHLLIHSLGGGRNEAEHARMVRALHPVYRANGIYPIFLQWEEPVWQDLGAQMIEKIRGIRERYSHRLDIQDRRISRLIEAEAAGVPSRHWENLEISMKRIFFEMSPHPSNTSLVQKSPAEGAVFFSLLFDQLKSRHRAGTMSYHLSGHDLGAIFAAEFLANSPQIKTTNPPVISTLHLISPLIDDLRFTQQILPFLSHKLDGKTNRKSKRDAFVLERASLWNLDAHLMERDRFDAGYDHAWPEFWARVQALSAMQDNVDKSELAVEGRNKRQFYLKRVLALSRFADRYLKDLKTSGYDVSHNEVSSLIQNEHRPQHARLDSVPEVVNGIMKEILGKEFIDRPMTVSDWELTA
ncbi:MAG: C1 family peptidase [Pseudomonadota bacterium]